jgi:hypothetical protein
MRAVAAMVPIFLYVEPSGEYQTFAPPQCPIARGHADPDLVAGRALAQPERRLEDDGSVHLAGVGLDPAARSRSLPDADKA